MKYWRSALLAPLALTACTAEPPEPVTPSPEPAPVVCPDSGVRVSTGLAEAASGLRIQHLNLTNCGDEPYHLNGYPLLRVLDADGEPLDVRVVHGSSDIATVDGFDTPPGPLTLQPGDAAETGLLWRNTHTGTAAPRVGETVSIAPAEGRPWQTVLADDPETGLHLDLGSTDTLGVQAWHQKPH